MVASQALPTNEEARERLLAGIPVTRRRLRLAGISTEVLEGGDGPPLILLHGPTEHAVKWTRVLPHLTGTWRVIAPDLPGHGTSEVDEGPLEADRVLAWLGELIDSTCSSPPALVGQILGGAIAARFAAARGERIHRLVLSDSLGLAPFNPAPQFGQALNAYLAQPTADTHDALWTHCAHDLAGLCERMGDRWEPFAAYNLECARNPSTQEALHALMGQFGLPAIAEEELARIRVPTTLIWGRHDLATSLSVAEAAHARYGWPLHVIDGAADDPPIEQPEAFAQTLRAVLDAAHPQQ